MVDRNPERFRKVILEEMLVEVPEEPSVERQPEAPLAARIFDETWKGGSNNQPQVTRDASGKISEFVRVAMGPTIRDGKKYYSVRREVVYPNE